MILRSFNSVSHTFVSVLASADDLSAAAARQRSAGMELLVKGVDCQRLLRDQKWRLADLLPPVGCLQKKPKN